jgi:hypothetical protein
VAGLACCAVAIKADGPGHSFTSLTSPFTQELYGVTASPVVISGVDGFIGGVAFTPTGDVWAPECYGFQYHRFDREGRVPDGHGGVIHSESLLDLSTYAPAPIGCGVVNHPSYGGVPALFANTDTGLWPLDAESGTPVLGGPTNSPTTHAGNGRGIDIDPADAAYSLVYAAADCDPAMRPSALVCTLWSYSPVTNSTGGFARFNRASTESIESVHFSPDGAYVFASYRGAADGTQGLIVLAARRGALLPRNTVDDSQILGRIHMSSMPQGVAFRTVGDFAVTLNEDGTMTRLTFPGAGFSGVPAQSTFASGGFRGGHLRVGADECIYAPQGRMFVDGNGVRYSDDAVAPNDSVVRICGGFAPAPGVAGSEWTPEPGSISGSAFSDWNRNGARDADEPGVSGVLISMSGSSTGSAITSSNGGYVLSDVLSGLYSVSGPVTVGDLSGNPTPLAVDLAAGENRPGVDFPYTESTPPVCTSTAPSGSPTRVDFTLRDLSGLRRVVVRAVSNFQVSVGGAAPVTGPVTVDFPTPAAGDVAVVATRSDAAQAASVELEAVDVFGNPRSCSVNVPASTTTTTPPPAPDPGDGGDDVIRRELSARGRLDVEVVKIPHTMRYVTIHNGRQGLDRIEVFVNHRWFLSGPLTDGQVKVIDISRALVNGKKNRIVLIGRGRSHDSAVVTISSHQ